MRSSQAKYNTILDGVKARVRGLSQGECERVLMKHGYSYQQAKNGAYLYLHHSKSLVSKCRGSTEKYARILNAFGASEKEPKECVAHLESMGFSYGQSHTAVYKYRCDRGLERRRKVY